MNTLAGMRAVQVRPNMKTPARTTGANLALREYRREKVLSYIRDNPAVTSSEIAEAVGMTISSVTHTLGPLKDEGLLSVKKCRLRTCYTALGAR